MDSPILYTGTAIDVRPGDQVTIRRWFRARAAVVVYVPGVSPPHAFFGDEYVREVGIRTDTLRVYGVVVDPVTSVLNSTVSFRARGDAPAGLPAVLDDDVVEN